MSKPKVTNLPKGKKLPENIKLFFGSFAFRGYTFRYGYVITTVNGKITFSEVVYATRRKADVPYIFPVDGKLIYPYVNSTGYVYEFDHKRMPLFWNVLPDTVVYHTLDEVRSAIVQAYYKQLKALQDRYRNYLG